MKRSDQSLQGIVILVIVSSFYVLSRVLTPAQVSLLLLGVAFGLFFTEAIPIAFTAVLVPVVLSITGILDANLAFSYFGYKWVIVFLFMFMVGEGLFRTGAAQKIGELVVRISGTDEVRLMLLIMVVTSLLSGFLSNTATTVALLPIVVGASRSAGISPKRMLLPLAWAASLGGNPDGDWDSTQRYSEQRSGGYGS